MYLLTVIAIIVFGLVIESIVYTRNHERKYKLPHDSRGTAGKLFGAAVATLLLTLTISCIVNICDLVPSMVQKKFSAQLVAITGNDCSSGTFATVSGRVKGGFNYLVYTRNADDSVTPSIIRANNTIRIIEDDSLTNTVIWSQFITVPDKTSFISNWTIIAPSERVWRNELRVPRGTVRQHFSTN